MDIKVSTNISNEYKCIEIQINAPERNEDVQRIENELLAKQDKIINKIIGMQDNDIFIINVSDVITFYSDDKNNFCKTKDGIYKVKEKLYYLEDKLPQNDFIRISNSVIANINHVKCFNTSIIGKIIIKFKDNSEETVSRRKTSEIMSFLRNRRD